MFEVLTNWDALAKADRSGARHVMTNLAKERMNGKPHFPSKQPAVW